MQINNIQNKPSFSGIYLADTSFEEVRDVAMYLKFKGYHALGFKKYYLPKGSFYEQQKKSRAVKKVGLYGIPKEFGTVYYPWCGSAYLIASPKTEQAIYELVKKIRPNAILDMFV